MCYWLNVPTVTPADLQRLQQPELAPATAAPTAPLRPGQQPKQHTPPAIEVGIAQSGKPSVMACPELVSTATSTESPAGERSSVALCMDLVSLDAEEVLLRAAQANAAIQLGVPLHPPCLPCLKHGFGSLVKHPTCCSVSPGGSRWCFNKNVCKD